MVAESETARSAIGSWRGAMLKVAITREIRLSPGATGRTGVGSTAAGGAPNLDGSKRNLVPGHLVDPEARTAFLVTSSFISDSPGRALERHCAI